MRIHSNQSIRKGDTVRRIGLLLCLLVFVSVSAWAAKGPKDIEYAALMLDGKKIGHMIHTRKMEDGKVRTSETINMRIVRSGVPITSITNETCIETLKGEPLSFESEQTISGIKQTSKGTITPDGKIDVTVTMMGIPQKKVIDWPKGAIMFEGMRLLELDKKLARGETFSAKAFTPLFLSAVDTTVTVGDKEDVDLLGRVVKLTKLTLVMKSPLIGEMSSTSYVDDDMNPLKTTSQMMGGIFEMLSCDKEFALSENDVVDFLDRMFVQSPRPLGELSSESGLEYTMMAKEGCKPSFPSEDNQIVKKLPDGRIQITVQPIKAVSKAKLPYRGKDEAMLEALKPSTYLQSDLESIRDLAKQAVGNEKDAAAAAKKIESFVNTYITQKDLSIGYATAGEVAAGKQGDCTEHAVLTAAMCRAAGIPARVAVGLVYVDSFADRKHVFGGHAWTQANIGGKWINLDATRVPRENPAGYILLGMGNGDPQDFFGMVNTLGCFTIESVEPAK